VEELKFIFLSATPQPTQYLTITTHNGDELDNNDVEKIHLKKLIALMRNNKCNMSILSEPDLELLAALEPNSFADVIGKDFVEHLKEASSR
jgi:DNA fragmentation factor alpha subunit